MSSLSSPLEFIQRETYRLSSDEVFPVGGDVRPAVPLQLPIGRDLYVTVSNATLTTALPNFFAWSGFDNRRIRIKTTTNDPIPVDVHGWVTVVLRTGRYEVSDVAAAINSYIVESLSWYFNKFDPALTLQANPSTGQASIGIDDTKLDPAHGAHLVVDMSLTSAGSDMAYTLGFSELVFPLSNPFGVFRNIWYSDVCPRVDSQGTYTLILSDLLPARDFSVVSSDAGSVENHPILALIPITENPSQGPTQEWPITGISATVRYQGPRTLSAYKIWSLSGRAHESRTSGFPLLAQGFGLVFRASIQISAHQ